MIFMKMYASPARAGRIALAALCFTVAGAALATLPMIGTALADHGEGGGHDGGGRGHDGSGNDHSGPGRGTQTHDNRGHDDAADHDANDDNGGLAGGGADDPADHDANDDNGGLAGGGADDPANHDANDDNGTDGTVLQPTSAN
jgi:merozoite surface protein 4